MFSLLSEYLWQARYSIVFYLSEKNWKQDPITNCIVCYYAIKASMCINPSSCILAKWWQKSHMIVEIIENCYRFNVFEKNLFSRCNPSPEIHYKSLPANMSSSFDHKWQVFQVKLIHIRISHKSCWFGLPCFSILLLDCFASAILPNVSHAGSSGIADGWNPMESRDWEIGAEK